MPGSMYEFGPIVVEQDKVVEFSKLYDPFVFDSGLEAFNKAKNGEVVTSGWHIATMGMRLLADFYISQVAGTGQPTIDEIRWLKAVHAGDKLFIRVTIKSRKLMRSKSRKGVVRSHVEILNQNSEVVTTLKVKNVLLCRENASHTDIAW